jgi:hypothetical protein
VNGTSLFLSLFVVVAIVALILFWGAVAARGPLTDSQPVYVVVVALVALVGECGELARRPWSRYFWYPASNAAWVISWTSAA